MVFALALLERATSMYRAISFRRGSFRFMRWWWHEHGRTIVASVCSWYYSDCI